VNMLMNLIRQEIRYIAPPNGEDVYFFDTVPECDGHTDGQTDRWTLDRQKYSS